MNRPDVMPRQAWPGPMPGPDAPVGTAAFGHTRATRIAACCFVSLLLIAFIGTAPFDEWAMSVDTGQGDVLNQALVSLVCVILFAGTHVSGQLRRAIALPASLLLLLGYCLLTSTWAIEPLISLRRLTLTCATLWALFRSISQLGTVRTLRLLRDIVMIMIVVNYFAVFLLNSGIHAYIPGQDPSIVGDWRGIFHHKNIAGSFLGLVVLLLIFDTQHTPRLMRYIFAAAALFFLWMTHSKTSIAMLGAALLVGTLIKAWPRRERSLLVIAAPILIIMALPLLSMFEGKLVEQINDPYGFTGRNVIWRLLLDYAGQHLWTGAGFGSFWQIGTDSPIWSMSNNWVARAAGHGHNGYLDLLVTIGLPGLILALVTMFIWPALLLLLGESVPGGHRSLYFAMLTFVLGDNMTETSLLDRMAVVQVFLVIVICLIHNAARASQGRHHQYRRKLRRLLRLGLPVGVRHGGVAHSPQFPPEPAWARRE
ncbi:MAG: O-antigen ligase family protein [Pseudomonadota bacterium]|nr:O-antigen ligase family protein [Pseudomonadota bacterium]